MTTFPIFLFAALGPLWMVGITTALLLPLATGPSKLGAKLRVYPLCGVQFSSWEAAFVRIELFQEGIVLVGPFCRRGVPFSGMLHVSTPRFAVLPTIHVEVAEGHRPFSLTFLRSQYVTEVTAARFDAEPHRP